MLTHKMCPFRLKKCLNTFINQWLNTFLLTLRGTCSQGFFQANTKEGRKLIINSFSLSNFSSVRTLHISNTELPHLPRLSASACVFFGHMTKLPRLLQAQHCFPETWTLSCWSWTFHTGVSMQVFNEANLKQAKKRGLIKEAFKWSCTNQRGQTHQPCWVKSLFEDEWTDLFKVMYLRLKLEGRERREEFHRHIFIFHLGFPLCLLPSSLSRVCSRILSQPVLPLPPLLSPLNLL